MYMAKCLLVLQQLLTLEAEAVVQACLIGQTFFSNLLLIVIFSFN